MNPSPPFLPTGRKAGCSLLLVALLLPVTGLARQATLPRIEAVHLVPDSVLQVRYRKAERTSDLDLPVDLIAQIVHEFLTRSAPGATAGKAPPAPSLTTGHVQISSPRTGLTYSIQIYVDSLIQIDYRQDGRDHRADLPPEVLTNLVAHYEALTGTKVVPDLELFWNDWKVWFRVARHFDLRVLLSIMGVFLFAGLFVRSRMKVLHLRAERDELASSRRRMIEAREAERSYLAAELHDGPVQELQRVLRTYILPLARTLPPEDDRQALEAVRTALQQVTGDLRNLCTELRPPVLVHFGLDKAIRSYVRLVEAREPGFSVALTLDEEKKTLPLPVRLALFRICQEALTNVARHAGARHVAITLTLTPEEISLTVTDDGRGFAPPRRWIDLEAEGHLGLSGLAQRAESIGGTLTLTTAPGAGTTVHVRAPRPQTPDPSSHD